LSTVVTAMLDMFILLEFITNIVQCLPVLKFSGHMNLHVKIICTRILRRCNI